jgi:hypothetical protein
VIPGDEITLVETLFRTLPAPAQASAALWQNNHPGSVFRSANDSTQRSAAQIARRRASTHWYEIDVS